MELYEHQKRIIADDPKKCLIALGTGGGKTRVDLELASGSTLVICPKQQFLDRTWELNAEKFGIVINLKVVSKEWFRKNWHLLGPFETVIIDECHTVLGVSADTVQRGGTEYPKTSQLFDAVRSYLRAYPPQRLYLTSATAVTKPMHLWALATLLGQNWSFWDFRAKYYFSRKMGFRTIYLPRDDDRTKGELVETTKRFGYFGQLSDWFDVPEQTHRTVMIELTPEQRNAVAYIDQTEADPLVKRGYKRTIENGVLYTVEVRAESKTVDNLVDIVKTFPSRKIDYIVERAKEFPKLAIFAAYTAQIEMIATALKKEGYRVETVTGKTKDRGIFKRVDDGNAPCIFVIQSSISSGYELKSFPCIIFASKSWRYVDYEQGIGRPLRADAIKKNLYIHLIVEGGVDEDCHDAIMSGQDFQEKLMQKDI